MARFLFVKGGITRYTAVTIFDTDKDAATNAFALVTDSPLTFDWDAVFGDLTFATFTGSTPIDLSAAGVTGPFVDEANNELFYKYTTLSWTNTGATTETITGCAMIDAAGTILAGLLVFDDEETVAPGDTLTLLIPVAFKNGTQDAFVEHDVA